MTKDGINTGNAAINHLNEEFSIPSSVALLRIDAKCHVNKYLMYQILSNQSQSRISNMISGNAITRLTLDKIKKLTFPFPSTKHEQELVSERISSIDSLINSIEKLVEKKKLIQQGVMQELLTGKRRLQGFDKGWETKKLNSLGSCITTGRKDVNEGNPNGKYPFFTCSRSITFSDQYSFDSEAILIAGNGDVGTLHYYNGKFVAYQRTYVLSTYKVPCALLKLQLDSCS